MYNEGFRHGSHRAQPTYDTGPNVNDYYGQNNYSPGYNDHTMVDGHAHMPSAGLGDSIPTEQNNMGLNHIETNVVKTHTLDHFKHTVVDKAVSNKSDKYIAVECILDFKDRLSNNVLVYRSKNLEPFILPANFDVTELEKIGKLTPINSLQIRFGSGIDKEITNEFNHKFSEAGIKLNSFVDDYSTLIRHLENNGHEAEWVEVSVDIKEWFERYFKTMVVEDRIIGIPEIKYYIVGIPNGVKAEFKDNAVSLEEMCSVKTSATYEFLNQLELPLEQVVLVDNETETIIGKGY